MARLLLDENMPRRLARSLVDHDASTVREMQWTGLRNGALLRRAAGQFEVFVTMDKSIPFQQVIVGIDIAVLVIRAPSNSFATLSPHATRIGIAAAKARPRQVLELDLRLSAEG